jgi:hypothetical protein
MESITTTAVPARAGSMPWIWACGKAATATHRAIAPIGIQSTSVRAIR